MALFACKSMSQTHTLADVQEDLRSARKAAQYRFGRQAVYLPAFPGTRYLPYSAVTRGVLKKSSLAPKGCCGAVLPMLRLRLDYDGEFYQEFLFEKKKDAEQALAALRAARPELLIEVPEQL